MPDPFALPGPGVSLKRKKKPKAPTPNIGQRALGALEYVGEKLSQATLYPLTNAIQALSAGKPVGKAVKSGFKGKGIEGEGKAKAFGGVFEQAGADPKKISTRIAAGAANVIVDPINAIFPFGKTTKGVEAAKGLIPGAKNLAEAADLGHRALLTAKIPGVDPITLIKGRPVLKSMSYVGQGISKLPAVQQMNAAITGKTGHPLYDALKAGEFQRGNRAANIAGIELAAEKAPKFEAIAKAAGKQPDVINKAFLEYITAPQRSDISALKPTKGMVKKLEGIEKKLPALAKGVEREVTLRKKALPSHIENVNPTAAKALLEKMKAEIKPGGKKRVDFNVGDTQAKMNRKKLDKLIANKDQPIPIQQLSKVPKEVLDQEKLVGKLEKSYDFQKGAYLKGVEGLTPEGAVGQAIKEIQEHSTALRVLRSQKEAIVKHGMKSGSIDYEKLQSINKAIGERSSRLKAVLASNVGKHAKATSQKQALEAGIASRSKRFEEAVTAARAEAKADMPKELVEMADDAMKLFDKMGKELTEFKPGTQLLDGYFKHIFTDEAKAIMDKLPKDGTQRKAFSTFISAALHRKFQGKNINEWNNMAMSGQLIKGKQFKLFEDNVPLVMATALQQHERMKNTARFIQETGKLIGKTADDFETQVKAGFIKADEYRLTNVPELKGLYVPKEVANDLERTYKFLNDPENIDAVSKLLNNINSWYKSYTLPLYPAYHVRNVVGNLLNNAYAGVLDPRDYFDSLQVLRKQPFQLKVGGEMWDQSRIMKEAELHGVIDQGFYAIDTGLDEGYQSLIKAQKKPVGAEKFIGPKSVPVEVGRKVGTFFENHARVAHFISKLKDGYTPIAAGMSVNKYLFNYADLGWLSKKARMIFPFLTWTLKNVPLQIENMITKPGLMGAPERFRQGLSGPETPDERYFSDYMAENFPAYIRTNEKGIHEYFLGGSWIPQADISRVFGTGRNLKEIAAGTPKQILQTISGLLTPVLKEPIAQAFNYDPYFGNEIQKFPGEQQKLNYPGGQVQLPARLVHAAKQFRPVSEMSNLFNPDVGTDKNVLRVITGLKTSPYDLEKSRARKVVEVRRELGKLKGLRNYYIKNNDQKNLKAVEVEIDKLMAGIK